MSALLRAHAIALICAAAFGVAVAGPILLIHKSTVHPPLTDDQNFYLSRIQEVRDGYPMSGNSYFTEVKTVLPMQFLTGEVVEAHILDTLSLPTAAAVWFFPLILCPLVFMLTYTLFLMTGAPRRVATLTATVLLGGIFFVSFLRPISPSFNFPFWLLAVCGFVALVKEPTWRNTAIEAVLVGLLFYIYPYYWTHLMAALGAASVIFLVIQPRVVARLVAAGAGAAVGGAGYLLLALHARTLPEAEESFFRLGFVHTHFPSGIVLLTLAAAALAVAAALLYNRRNTWMDPRIIAGVALVVAGGIAMNQHLVTGLNMEFSSHYAMQITFATLFLVLAALSLRITWPHVPSWLVVLVPTLVFGYGAYTVVGIIREATASHPDYAQYPAIVAWLKDRGSGTVFAPEDLSEVIPAYTANDVFFTREGNIGFMRDADVLDRFLIEHYGAVVNDTYIAQHERAIFGNRYLNAYNHAVQKAKLMRVIGVNYDLPERLPKVAVDEVKTRAKELQSKPFLTTLAPYRVTYIIIDTRSSDGPTTADLAPLSPLFTAGDYQVFERPVVR